MPDETDPLAGTIGVAAPTNPVSMQPPSSVQVDPASVPALGGDNLGPYTPQPAPVSSVDAPQLTDTIPSETAPNNPDIERHYHESTLHRILDRVGTILGGGETIHYAKDADGNVTITHTPSTTGEKWHRVAAAALGGAAMGLANSQGPGGLGKAAAAGVQYGLNVPQQERENVDAQATAEQKRMEANANMAKLHQDAYLGMLNNNKLKIAMDEKSAQLMNDYKDKLASSPDAKDYGPISGPDDLMRISSENADFLKNHMGLVMSAVPVPDGKGGTSLHAVAVDPGNDERMTSSTDQRFYIGNDDSGKPVLKSEPMGGARMKNRELRQANQGVQTQYMDQLGKWATTQKNLRPPAPKDKNPTLASLAETAANDPDPQERKNARRAIDLMKEKTGTGTSGEGGGGGGGRTAATTPQETEQFLRGLNPADAATVRAVGEIRNAPPNRATKEGQRLMGMVNQAYPDYDSTNYPAYLKTKLDYAPGGVTGKGLNFIGTALAHMDRMEGNVDALHNVSVPVVGSWYNDVKNAAMKGTSPAIKAFVDDQKAVTSEIARAYNGGAITVSERDHMMDLISTSDSPEAIRGSLQEFRELLRGKLDQYQIGWDAQMPRHQRNAVLDNLTARGTTYRPAAPAADTTPTPTPAPAGGGIKWPTDPPPQGQVWAIIPGQAPGHIPNTPAAIQAFKTKHPNAQVNQ